MTITEILTIFIAFTSLIVAYVTFHNNSVADVVIYAKVDKERPTILNLIIHNIGKGIAQNITIHPSRPIPKNAYGMDGLEGEKEFFDSGIFSNGIPILFPDEKLILDWGQYHGLLEALDQQPLNIKVSFYSKTSLLPFKHKITNTVCLDVSMFSYVSIGEPYFQQEVRSSLKSIATSLEKISKSK